MKRPNGELAPVSLLKMNSRVLAANGVVATVERAIPQPGNNHAVLSEGATVKPHLRARALCRSTHAHLQLHLQTFMHASSEEYVTSDSSL